MGRERRTEKWEKRNVEVAVFNRNSERFSVEFINMTSHPL